MVRKLKEAVKGEDEFIEKCEEYGEEVGIVDSIDLEFDDTLDVSAKTINKRVYLNGKLLDSPWEDQMRYVIHEFTHVLQQKNGKVTEESQSKEYLDDENEIEAFQAQLSFMSDYDDEEEIQEYLENLLDHHNITGVEREEKKEELLEEVK